ncbi:filamentous hemagglutinin N-terminal domain-containing protein [Thioflexithrix psekupsensis]|uniref:Filamentous haemagglutinin FhaB/tRNA nuclease CdiA-like TPS domain-containing protein n=1 Tax=Thioflexithrix psekupsensis TaxID=1570016 RepID=A0A251XCV0_9GAMM|nr:filamentous hemagglutinin N-terminal domain-containing protein [Thioflexithrix psekupsensis]OUD15745.1 hypothetical protein TPSD3_04345 [Thioflexithrix psekupsensis]
MFLWREKAAKKLYDCAYPYGLLFVCLLPSYSVSAQIITDGSLGAITELAGPDFHIDAHWGQQWGKNLFHSFQQFDLAEGESARFTSLHPVDNVIARITGEHPSQINGTVQVDMAQANLYLLNRHGFLFGPQAKIHLDGDLHLSTANQLFFSDNQVFSSDLGLPSALSSAPPVAFGFLGTESHAIEFKGSQIFSAPHKHLNVSAERIEGINAQLTAVAGQINLVGVKKAEKISYHAQGITTSPDYQAGTVHFTENSTLDVGKQIAGNIYIRSGQFVLNNSEIIANTDGLIEGGIISIIADEFVLDNRARIDSRTFGPSRSGNIEIHVTHQAYLSTSDILTTSRNPQDVVAGKAGNITLIVGELKLENSTISTDTFSTGRGGDIHISARQGIHVISRPSNNPFFILAAIQASSRSDDARAGDAGRITVQACDLVLSGENTRIENNTAGAGRGGNIYVVLKNALTLEDGAKISAESTGMGDAGNISILAKQVNLNHSVISTETSQADGGNIIINTQQALSLLHSDISATVTSGQGNGGNLAISNPHKIILDSSQLKADARGGKGGLILLISGQPLFLHQSIISASSETGLDGDIKVDLPNVDLNALPSTFLDASLLIKKRCELRTDDQLNSFIVLGQEALPNIPNDLQSYLPSLQQLELLLNVQMQ